jgi:hypothetical protein
MLLKVERNVVPGSAKAAKPVQRLETLAADGNELLEVVP